MTTDASGGGEHLLSETFGLFGKTVYECHHCGVRSPDDEYFDDIDCPPSIDDAQ